MEISEAQEKIREFDRARNWENDWNLKDILLNITEEGSELWSLVKWIEKDKERGLIEKNKDEASDYIGDVLQLVLKLANQMDVDATKALNQTLRDYEKRLPADVIRKVGTCNVLAGGVDDRGALNGD